MRREKEVEGKKGMESCNGTRTLPPWSVVLCPIFVFLYLASSSFAFCSSPSYIFRFLPCIVSARIHWVPLTFFTRQPQKACTHTRTIHTIIHETRCTGSSGVFRTFEFFPRVKSSIFSLFLLSRVSPLDFHLPYRCFSVSR